MRNKVFGGIGILWGGGIVLARIFAGSPSDGSGAYQTGQSGAVTFGGIMLAVGLYYFFKK